MTNPRLPRQLVLPGIFLLLFTLFAFRVFGGASSDSSRSATAPSREVPSPISTIPTPMDAERTSASAPPRASSHAAVQAPPSEASPVEIPAVAGMVIGKDPETGAWGPPTPEQLRELAELRNLSAADRRAIAKPDGPLPEVHHPDGHVSVELDGQFQEFTTVRLGPDGKPVFTCVQGPENAERTLTEPAAPALEER